MMTIDIERSLVAGDVRRRWLGRGVAAASNAQPVTPSTTQRRAAIDSAIKPRIDRYKGLKEGKNADYIPALAKVDPNLFGIALVTVDGQVYTVGDVKSEVSIQSISKVFTMARVVPGQRRGADRRQRSASTRPVRRSTRSSRSSSTRARR